MPLSRRLARFNKHITNRLVSMMAGWAPGFAIVHHKGRTTGQSYQTPVNVFHRDETYLFVLTYGSDADWVRNVVTAGGCSITTLRKDIELTEPHVYTDAHREGIPAPARWMLGLIDVNELMTLRTKRTGAPTDPGPS